MATVKCPDCRTVLELDDADLGRKVQCGNCQVVFTAEAMDDRPERRPGNRRDEDRPSRSRRSEDDEDRPSHRRDEEDEDRPNRSRRDEEDEDRPSRRRRDEDEEDDRPRRRSRRDYDEDEYDAEETYEAAKRDVTTPATIMMVLGIIVVALALLGTVINLAQLGGPPANQANGNNPALNAVSGVTAIVWGLIIAIGSYHMRNLKSRGWAMTAAILGMIPCSGCCIFTLPIGIWMLTVLNKPHVKDAMEMAQRE